MTFRFFMGCVAAFTLLMTVTICLSMPLEAKADGVQVFQLSPFDDVEVIASADGEGDSTAVALNAINVADVATENRGVAAFNIVDIFQEVDGNDVEVIADAFSVEGTASATVTNIGNAADVVVFNLDAPGTNVVQIDQVLHTDEVSVEAIARSIFGDASANVSNIGNVVKIETGSQVPQINLSGGKG